MILLWMFTVFLPTLKCFKVGNCTEYFVYNKHFIDNIAVYDCLKNVLVKNVL